MSNLISPAYLYSYARHAGWLPSIAGGTTTAIWRANEPVGFTLDTERAFSAQPEDGWGLVAASGDVANFSIEVDSTAPKTPSNVGRIKYPLNFAGGGEPCNTFRALPTWYKRLYVCTAHKFSSNWYGHPTETNKIFHLFIDSVHAGANRLYMNARGADTSSLRPQISLQGLAANYDAASQGGEGNSISVALKGNQGPDPLIVRNTWMLWELLIDAGTVGGADGTVKWWIDNVLIGSYTLVPFVAAGGTAAWEELHWAPTWGGGGSTVPEEQYQYCDHVYASGSNT